jgi:hypothetical protein
MCKNRIDGYLLATTSGKGDLLQKKTSCHDQEKTLTRGPGHRVPRAHAFFVPSRRLRDPSFLILFYFIFFRLRALVLACHVVVGVLAIDMWLLPEVECLWRS